MKTKSIKGFTLIELIVTIAVLGTLVLLAAPKFSGHIQDAELTRGFSDAKSIQKASELYFMDNEDWPRLTDEPYNSEEIKAYSEHIYDTTGKEVQLDPNGNYYNIDYDKLSEYVKVPANKENYILQNPVGKVFYMENMTEEGQNRVDYGKQSEPELPILAEPIDFAYTGNVQEVTLSAGKYELEVWGAQGGGNLGGKGGYAKGELYLTKDEVLNVYIGGQGDYHNKNGDYRVAGGWNGGGTGGDADSGGGGGGGASDIRINGTSLHYRAIVAAGGGGSGGGITVGYGGGLIGGSSDGAGGTQYSGGAKGARSSVEASYNVHSSGILGIGGLGNGNDGGGGGGGYYGGGGSGFNGGGGGGSSYIGGVQSGQTISGNQSMPNQNGGTIIGNSGDGFARITKIENN